MVIDAHFKFLCLQRLKSVFSLIKHISFTQFRSQKCTYLDVLTVAILKIKQFSLDENKKVWPNNFLSLL